KNWRRGARAKAGGWADRARGCLLAGCVWVAYRAALCRGLPGGSRKGSILPSSWTKWHSRGRGFDSHQLHLSHFTIRSAARTLSVLGGQAISVADERDTP